MSDLLRKPLFWTNFALLVFIGIVASSVAYGWANPSANPIGGGGQVFVSPTGNVGFGVALPVQKLDIAGSVQWSGSLVGGNVPWASLINFPAACALNQFMSRVGQLPSCNLVSWLSLSGIPAGFADGIDDVGGVTSVTSGTGISNSPATISTTGSIAVNNSYVQRRIFGICPVGQVITSIAIDGTVVCASTLGTFSCTTGAGRKVTAGGTCFSALSATCSAGGVTTRSSNLYVCSKTTPGAWSGVGSNWCIATTNMVAC